MVFDRKNRDSYTFIFGAREKTFKMNHVVISGRRPTAEYPEGVRQEDGYCFTSHGLIGHKQGINMDPSRVLSTARQKVKEHSVNNQRLKLARRDHRAYGKDYRCVGAPDCIPDPQKKQYCMTCGGVRFSRDDFLQQRLSTADAVFEAIRQDDVIRLRACILLKGSKAIKEENEDTKDTKVSPFFLDLQSIKGPLGSTAVHMCCEYRATQCLNFMFRLQSSRYIDMFTWTDANGATPLHVAARMGWAVQKMVRQGAAPTVRISDNFGLLPIHYAALRASVEDLRELLNAGSTHYQLHKCGNNLKTVLECVDRSTQKGLQQCIPFLKSEILKMDDGDIQVAT
jgi:hypothetical protein